MQSDAAAPLGPWCEKKCPAWLRLAAGRQYGGTILDAAQIVDLAVQCVAEAEGGLVKAACPIPASAMDPDRLTNLRLVKIGDIKGINALAPRKALEFGKSNLTVIYGHNGSGKSGYVRLLKHMCGARSPGTIHADVFSATPQVRGCSVSFELEGQIRSLTWQIGQESIEELRGVDVFDVDTAQSYDSECEVAYEPPVLAHLTDLANVCDGVSVELDHRMQGEKSVLPNLPPAHEKTIAGEWYLKLSSTTTDAEVTEHCTWTSTDDTNHAALKARIGEQDPFQRARELRGQAVHARRLAVELERSRAALDDVACTNIDDLRKKCDIAVKAACVAADRAFAQAPLQGVGEDIWRELWSAARRYSEALAYPGQNYPSTMPGSLCVLCQQELTGGAGPRLQAFDEFVRGELSAAAEAGRKAYNDAIEALPNEISDQDVGLKLDAARVVDPAVRDTILASVCRLRHRRQAVVAEVQHSVRPSIPTSEQLGQALEAHAVALEAEAARFDADAQSRERSALVLQALELDARAWVCEQVLAIRAEIERKSRLALLERAKRLATTTAISKKKGELAEQLVSKAFQERFLKELGRLNGQRIRVQLEKTRVFHGRALHQIHLDTKSKVSMPEVLSEGERRLISLAAFLADSEGRPTATPFVFDDPVSSLDQEFEESVVARLVDLAATRQVLVFTHRLSMLVLLQEASAKAGTDVNTVCIRSEPWGAGEPNETPLDGKKPGNALRSLRDHRLAQAAKVLKESGTEEYFALGKGICGDFRIILERMVETCLLADVVQRFRRSVNTLGKLQKLTKITQPDVDLIEELMTKYSIYEHSQPMEAPSRLPQPDELKTDMDRLDAWCVDFAKR
jgi:energy-coupling factor transporter ATP-binding protein EcfA2